MIKFEEAFGKWVVQNRWPIIVATILMASFAISGARFLTITNDTRVFFSKENPQLQALEELENTYAKNENVFFVVAPDDGEVFTRETLAALEELTKALWRTPYSSRVDSLTNFQHTRAEEDDLIVENLVEDAMELSDDDLARIKQTALSEPELLDRVISPSGHATGVNVSILRPGESLDEVPTVAAFAHGIADEFRQNHPSLQVHMTGGIMLDNAFGEASEADMKTLVPTMFLVLVVLTGLSLRSFVGTFGTLAIILLSMATGMGLAGWLGISLSAASINSPTIILTLAVADSIHLLVTIFQQMRSGKEKREAIAESLRINFQPIFLTSITTAIGFLSMNFSDAPPFRDLGNIVAMGVMAAWVYSVTFLPALVSVLPVRVKAKQNSSNLSCNWLADLAINRQKLMFWSILGIAAIITAGISGIELNDNFVQYFGKRFEFRKDTDFIQKNLTGFDIIEYSLDSGEPGGINNPEYLNQVEEFSNWFRNQPKIVHVSSIANTMKRLNKDMHAGDEAFYRIPDQRDLAAQYLLLYEMSLPFGLDLNNRINVDKSATRLTAIVKGTNTREQRELEEKSRAWLKANAPENMFTHGTGLSMIWAHISERNINSMLGASFGALVLISMILILALRSFKLGAMSLIPNLTPAFMAFGVWGLTVGQVGLGLSVIVSMTLGIVVDDTIHFLSKYLRARREYNMPPQDAVRFAFNTVGTAMWVTSFVLVAGFLVLASSGFKINSEMGLMSALTITFALVMDYLLLPTLLLKVEKK